jgi:hypothetical protein
MSGTDFTTTALQTQKPATALAVVFVVAGATNPLGWAEFQQQRQASTDSNQAHRDWLAAHGFDGVNPSEVFAAS